MKIKPSKVKHFLNDDLNLTGTDLYCKMALSILPQLREVLSKSTYDRIQGGLRRGNLDSIEDPEIDFLLSQFRTGERTCSPSLFSNLYQFKALFSKLPPNGSSDLQDENAIKVFLAGEKKCCVTNRFLRKKVFPTDSIHWEVKSLIYEILGDLPDDFLNQEVTFGPGSTVNPGGRGYAETNAFFKLSDKLYVNESSKVFLAAHLSYQPFWINSLALHYHINDDVPRLQYEMSVFDKHFVPVPDVFPNRLGFVPKKKDVSRTIGVELNGQVILQQCMGRLIRTRLKHFGLNLNSQSRNQHLARMAKVFGLSTVDVENASNTLSIETVRKLLPSDWFCVLDCFRQKAGSNKKHLPYKQYDMFSSMGNGFTFELESLIFYCIALCVARRSAPISKGAGSKTDTRTVAVYGDDIIVPQNCYTGLVSVLRMYGFKVNDEKSFHSGLFFESCGFDYYDSVAVRPFFVRRHVKTIRDAYFMCNSVLFKMTKSCNIFLLPAYLTLWKAIPESKRLLGPLHYESGLKRNWDESVDDLEACLRVPLSFAQSNGAVKFNYDIYSYEYKKFRFVSPIVPLSLSSQYAVKNILYLMLIKDGRSTKVTLRGFSNPVLVKKSTSRWDGLLTKSESAVLSYSFSEVPQVRLNR